MVCCHAAIRVFGVARRLPTRRLERNATVSSTVLFPVRRNSQGKARSAQSPIALLDSNGSKKNLFFRHARKRGKAATIRRAEAAWQRSPAQRRISSIRRQVLAGFAVAPMTSLAGCCRPQFSDSRPKPQDVRMGRRSAPSLPFSAARLRPLAGPVRRSRPFGT